MADIAALNLRADRIGDAAACYRQLVREFADVPCHAGLTPAAWLAALPKGDELRKEINRPAADWPKGVVEVSKSEGQAVNPYNGRAMRFDMTFGGCTGPFFNDYTVSFENNQQEIAFRDGFGHAQKPLPVRLSENGRMPADFNANNTSGQKLRAFAAGHRRNENLSVSIPGGPRGTPVRSSGART